MSRRRQEEFYCAPSGGGCGKYFITYLRDNMSGRYTIECPNPKCHHQHFRNIESGLVTDSRHDDRKGSCEIILGLEATLRDIPWHDDPEFKRQQLKAYDGGVKS